MKRSSFSVASSDPPFAWFCDPGLEGPTPLHITDEGRVFGHVALWGTCHIGIPGACVTPPRSASGYSYFHLGARRTAEGEDVPVGSITMDCGHPSLRLSAEATTAHYDHTGTGAADVALGEDSWGIWAAGAVRRSLSVVQLETLRSAKLSGDWRTIAGRLELVGLLAVNVPGFPVTGPRARVASGEAVALVAAGRVPRSQLILDRLAGVAVAERQKDLLLFRAKAPPLMDRLRR